MLHSLSVSYPPQNEVWVEIDNRLFSLGISKALRKVNILKGRDVCSKVSAATNHGWMLASFSAWKLVYTSAVNLLL